MLADRRRGRPLAWWLAGCAAHFIRHWGEVYDADIYMPYAVGRLELRGRANLQHEARRTHHIWQGKCLALIAVIVFVCVRVLSYS